MARLCVSCGDRPGEVRDRNGSGGCVCRRCYGGRLLADLAGVERRYHERQAKREADHLKWMLEAI